MLCVVVLQFDFISISWSAFSKQFIFNAMQKNSFITFVCHIVFAFFFLPFSQIFLVIVLLFVTCFHLFARFIFLNRIKLIGIFRPLGIQNVYTHTWYFSISDVNFINNLQYFWPAMFRFFFQPVILKHLKNDLNCLSSFSSAKVKTKWYRVLKLNMKYFYIRHC